MYTIDTRFSFLTFFLGLFPTVPEVEIKNVRHAQGYRKDKKAPRKWVTRERRLAFIFRGSEKEFRQDGTCR